MRAVVLAVVVWAASQLVSPVPLSAVLVGAAVAVTVAVAPAVDRWTAGGAS